MFSQEANMKDTVDVRTGWQIQAIGDNGDTSQNLI